MGLEIDVGQFFKNAVSESRAARLLGISVMTLRSYREKGRIEALVGGGAVLYAPDEIEEFREKWIPVIQRNGRRAGWGRTRVSKSQQAIDQLAKHLLPRALDEAGF